MNVGQLCLLDVPECLINVGQLCEVVASDAAEAVDKVGLSISFNNHKNEIMKEKLLKNMKSPYLIEFILSTNICIDNYKIISP